MEHTETEQEGNYDEAGDRIIRGRDLTLEERLRFEKAKQKHRDNVTKDQVVKGKVFKGLSFIIKPDKILFSDFTVGKTHSLALQVTNVSNAFNSFNVLPLDQRIRNFFEIEYVPQGKISPGLSCPLTVKFTPIVNEDIEDSFYILAETGKIAFPITCTSKKSIVSCDSPVVDFGDVIFGEKGHSHLILRNTGLLPTEYTFKALDQGQDEDAFKENSSLKVSPEGDIEGNIEIRVPFEVAPMTVGRLQQKLQLSFRDFKHSPPIIVTVIWNCTQLPIFIQKDLYDCELVLTNHIYRRQLVFHNRGNNTMKVHIHQPPNTKDFFEFNPSMGYIQRQSELEIWVKITLEKDPALYLAGYSKGEGRYEVEFKLVASGQLMPVPFRITFCLTSDVLRVTPDIVHFGNIYEDNASRSTLVLENTGSLLQEVLLYPVPKQIYIEENQSSLKILPKEVAEISLVYRPESLSGSRSRKDEGELCFKIISGSLSARDVIVKFDALILRKELDLSKKKIELPALQIDEKCLTNVEIKNTTTRDIQFELVLPPFTLAGLQISPRVGKLKGNQTALLCIQFTAGYRELTYELYEQMLPAEGKLQLNQKELPLVETPKKDSKKEPKLTKQQVQQLEAEKKVREEEQLQRLAQEKLEREQRIKSFNPSAELQKHGGKFVKFEDSQVHICNWVIPIYYRTLDSGDNQNHMTFIEVTSTSVSKRLSISEAVVDFGHVVVGTRETRAITITSLSQEQQQLRRDQTSVFSGFSVANCLRSVGVGKPFNLVLEFSPYQEQPFKDILRLYTETESISCQLRGRGVRPEVLLTPENGILSLGGILAEESIERSFRFKNNTEFSVKFSLEIVKMGLLNKDQMNAITFTPQEGSIEANKEVEIRARFKPDRVSQLYYNLLKINVPEQKNPKSIYIFGYSFPRQAYVFLFQPPKLYTPSQLPDRVEYVYDNLDVPDVDRVFGASNNKILLQFMKLTGGVEDGEGCFKQKIVIGSCKLVDPKLEKPTNFEVLMPKDDRFTVDQQKGTVAPGSEAVVTFTFKPPESDQSIANISVLQDIGQWRDTRVDLKVSGGWVKPGTADLITFEVTLRAYINQI